MDHSYLKDEMLKYAALLKEAKNFTTRKTGVDPETGTTSWDVEYENAFTVTYAELSQLVKRLQDHTKTHPQSQGLKKEYEILKSLKNRFARIMNTMTEASATSQGGANFTPGGGAQYPSPQAFPKKIKKKNIYYYKLGFKDVPKKIKGSGLEVKKLFESPSQEFQQERIQAFTIIEDELNDISPLLSNAKNETINFYSANPGTHRQYKKPT